MTVITDGFSVLVSRWSEFLYLLAAFAVSATLVFLWLKRAFSDSLTGIEAFILSVSGMLIPWVSVAFAAFSTNLPLSLGAGFLLFTLAVSLSVFRRLHYIHIGRISWLVVALLAVSIFVRLAFIAKLIVPSYFDAALHYAITRRILTVPGIPPWDGNAPAVTGVYHIGIHLITALFNSTFGPDINTALLIIGQLFLAVIPLPVFFLIRRETKSNLAALFAAALAAWGWYMPAHAMDWGKLPLLGSLLAFQFPLVLAFILGHTPPAGRARWAMIVLCLFGVFASTLVHSRSLVLITIFVVCYLFSGWWASWRGRGVQIAFFGVTLLGLILVGVTVQSRELLRLALDPYLRSGLWMTLIVLGLSIFAFKQFPRAAFACILSVPLLLASLFVPISKIFFPPQSQTLLDRPFVETVLFYPLALLGGLGLAGLVKTVNSKRVAVLLAVLLGGCLLFGLVTSDTFAPSECCILFGTDDAVAVNWLDKNLPKGATILIASTELRVLESSQSTEFHGSDGGLWIAPLTGRGVLMSPYRTDFRTVATHADLCTRHVTHVYVGGLGQHFDRVQLNMNPGWYSPLLSLPGANVYRVISCP